MYKWIDRTTSILAKRKLYVKVNLLLTTSTLTYYRCKSSVDTVSLIQPGWMGSLVDKHA